MKKKILYILLFIMLLIPLASCSSKKSSDSSNYDGGSNSSDQGSDSKDTTSDIVDSDGRKVIYTVSFTYSTKDTKEIIATVKAYVKEAGGYISSTNTYHYYGTDKKTHVYYKVPTEKLDEFVDKLEEDDKFEDKNISSYDITSTYDSIAVRIQRLEETQQMYKDEITNNPDMTLDQKIRYQDRISEIDYQLAELHEQQDRMSNEINYSTVHVTYIEKIPYNVAQGVGNFFAQLGLYFLGAIIVISPFAATGIVIYFVLRKKKNKEEETK